VTVLAIPPAAQAEVRYESPEFGFRLDRPAEWIVQSAQDQGEARFLLTLVPQGSAGNPSFVAYVYDAKAGTSLAAVADAAAKKLEAADVREIERGEARLGEREVVWLRGRKDDENLGAYVVEYRFVESAPFLYALQLACPPDDEPGRATLRRIADSLELFAAVPAARDPDRERLQQLAARCGSELDWAPDWESAAKRARGEKKPIFVLYENYAALGLPDTAVTGALMDPELVALLRERFVAFRLAVGVDAPFRDPEVFGIGPHAWGTDYLFVEPSGRVLRETSVFDPICLAEVAREVLGMPGAKPRDGEKALDRECDADEAVLLMRLGRHAEARAAFERIVAEDPPVPRAPEAMFWLGAYEAVDTAGKGPRAWWRRLVDEHPDDRWAWKAAANLLDAGALIRGAEPLAWPAPEVLATARTPAAEPLPVSAVHRAEKAAIAFLLAAQREDGSWIVPADAFGLGSSLYTNAVSALCATSLVPVAAGPGATSEDAARAVRLALRRALGSLESGALDSGEDLAGTYSIWGRAYVVGLLASCARARIGDREAIENALAKLVPSVEKSQHAHGGWPYVKLPGDPQGEGIDPSASFLTAGVLAVLADARAAGASVSPEVLERGASFLASLRQEDGSYRYMRDVPNRRAGDGFPEAAGRGPACALALHRAGRVDTDELRATLRVFVANRAGFRREWHKALCHTSPEGFGSHYLFFDYLFAARAVRQLPKKERAPFRDALLEDVLAERFADGSFEDIPLLGRPYATAMALLAFQELRGE
jgi:tetratricopeptide (TPR) repeat protein